MAALWAMAAVATQRPLGWMALITALDVSIMLSLLRLAPGAMRASLAAATTVLSITLAWWFIAASQMAPMFGLHPLQSLQRISPHLALSLSAASFNRFDLVLAAASIVLAAARGFGFKALSGRHPAP
ncbi:MAG: hypothetical protein CVV16_14400 [Gammaproteobacteria bacterium HGW-Gammaproteobacteria-6]|jgi:hypothetical protein|nr:MAG: hypothetical protein CVV16_14400 [Gammaproteobacteria bacterium HGW-Gammaproteobacteria-6]